MYHVVRLRCPLAGQPTFPPHVVSWKKPRSYRENAQTAAFAPGVPDWLDPPNRRVENSGARHEQKDRRW